VLDELIGVSGAVKARVAGTDDEESGQRTHLDLGKTCVNGVEKLTGYRSLLHGGAVMIGLVMAVGSGEWLGHTPTNVVDLAEACQEIPPPEIAYAVGGSFDVD